jgi:hypothetical protein
MPAAPHRSAFWRTLQHELDLIFLEGKVPQIMQTLQNLGILTPFIPNWV